MLLNTNIAKLFVPKSTTRLNSSCAFYFLNSLTALSEFILFLISYVNEDNFVFTWYVIPSQIYEPNLPHFSTDENYL